MRRNNYRTYYSPLPDLRFSRVLLPLCAAIIAFCVNTGFAQEIQSPAYDVISSDARSVVISFHPSYQFQTVVDEKTGERYERISFSGSTVNGIASGAPAAEYLALNLLAPSKELAHIDILNVEYTPSRNAMLAPVSKWSFANDEFRSPKEHIIRNTDLYQTSAADAVSIGSPAIYRTAYSQTLRINPISFDNASQSIRLVKSMTVKITFAASSIATASVKPQEAELFSNIFVNGNTYGFYHSAAKEVTQALSAPSGISYKKSASPQSDEKWLLVTTTERGVYHISSSQLEGAGITNADPATFQLFGYGGGALPEDLDNATGELHECALDVSGSGNSFDVRFYEPGLNEWYYSADPSHTPLYGLYHLLNPFTSSGHYLLKVGGNTSSKRITSQPEKPVSPLAQSTVATVAIHESEERFEHVKNISREFMGEEIPKGRDVSVQIGDLPGYTPDSSVLRPGFNSHDTQGHTFNLAINGTTLSSIYDRNSLYTETELYTTRKWDTEFLLGNELHAQNNTLTLSASSTNMDAKYWLNWVEIFYRRRATLTDGQVPFFVLADGRGFTYNFSGADNGEAWDVSDPSNPVKIAIASGSSMSVGVQGNANGFRQFIAFNNVTLKAPALGVTGSLNLHDGICQSGAEDIIVTPKEFLDQANRLAKQRTMGGQATGPLSVAVVTVEDIYREFGYGSPDYTAIRDFLAYTFRHTTANNTTKPLYLTLFSNGHCDYRNKTTQIPVGVPIYEIWKDSPVSKMYCNTLRNNEPDYIPEDPYYVRLTPGSHRMDVAVGRVTIHNPDEAEAFVTKVIKYETSSDEGDWRGRASFIADDRYAKDGLTIPDGLDHLRDTRNELEVMPGRIIQNDIFGVVYSNVYTAGGRNKPEMEKAIVNAFNSGSALISWVGHGNPAVWAHESILTVPSTINKLTNFNRLAFVTTATCDFSSFDNYAATVSGGVQLITKPDGGAIASLGTSRSVSPDLTATVFYKSLFNIGCNSLVGTTPIGFAYIDANANGGQSVFYYIMGDPTQRVIFPRQYVTLDSINGIPYTEFSALPMIPALSELMISGHISNACDGGDIDASFNGNTTVTLFDAPSHVSVTTTFLDYSPITDKWDIDGPILYRGSSTVTGGRFKTSFIVSKDIKFDTNNAKISMLAYSDNFRSALGVANNIVIYGIDTARVNADNKGPVLVPYIGSRAFHSGDVVPVNSKIIVDVTDISGLNSSTASIGHSFVAWNDDSTAGMIDLASTYVSKKDDFTSGTSEQQAQLPVGRHTLKVRAFDALNNPTFAEVDFIARAEEPYTLYNTTLSPNPVSNQAVFTFLQPSAPESPVDVTITIYTVIGQKIRELSAQGISQNSVSIPFDGKDDYGTPLMDGVYVYRVTAQERLSNNQTTAAGKLIMLRN